MDYKQQFIERKLQQNKVTAKPSKNIAFVTGHCTHNPGGLLLWYCVIYKDNGENLICFDHYESGTLNEAEYLGVLLCMEKCIELGIKEIDIKTNSQTIVNVLNGVWKCKAENIKPLFKNVQELKKRVDMKISWIPTAEMPTHKDGQKELYKLKKQFYN